MDPKVVGAALRQMLSRGRAAVHSECCGCHAKWVRRRGAGRRSKRGDLPGPATCRVGVGGVQQRIVV